MSTPRVFISSTIHLRKASVSGSMSFSTDLDVSTGSGVTDVVLVLEGGTVDMTSTVNVDSAGVVDLSANRTGNHLA